MILLTILKKLKIPLILLFSTLVIGVIGYKVLFPEATLNQVLYMTGITLSTVGYGDILGIDKSVPAIYFTMLLMLIGMGTVLYSISNVTAYIIEGSLKNLFRLESVKRRARKMKDHYIICGAGKTGIHVVAEMVQTNRSFIIIDNNEKALEKIIEQFPKALVVLGDATDDDVLKQANLQSAKGLIATLSNDKDNLYLTVSSKILNPNITIVSKAIDLSMVEKLKNAGAYYVVSPNFIGGMRIASEILRPHVVGFLDKMLRGSDKSIRVEEAVIPNTSKFSGKTIEEIKFFQKTGVNILAYSKNGEDYVYNPSLDTVLSGGEVILFIGDNNHRKAMTRFLSVSEIRSAA
tara:strand:- start:65015 stop:66058 length:1044 start_codon:yes stop_codon:yes gene_type:complete